MLSLFNWIMGRNDGDVGLKMGAMKAVYMDMAEDFENLTETSMQFKGNNWEAQDGRFEGKINYNLDYIYWFDNYANLMAARTILQDFGNSWEVLFDDALGQWTLITDYQSMCWSN